MGLPWFRMYVDFLDDPKMVGLAFEDQRHFIAICALKSDGVLDQNCTPEMLNRIVAQKIWVDFGVISDVKRRLQDAGLIDEFWQPVAWEKRQAKSDSSTDRVRKHREKQKEETGCNADETLQKRSSNALDKKRADKKREEKNDAVPAFCLPDWIDKDLWDEWMQIRKKLKAVNSDAAKTRLVNKLDKIREAGEVTPNKAIETAIERSWKGIEADWLTSKNVHPFSKPDPDAEKEEARREHENDELARKNGS